MELKTVNSSLTSQLSSLNEIMNRAFVNCSALQSELDEIVEEYHQSITDVQMVGYKIFHLSKIAFDTIIVIIFATCIYMYNVMAAY